MSVPSSLYRWRPDLGTHTGDGLSLAHMSLPDAARSLFWLCAAVLCTALTFLALDAQDTLRETTATAQAARIAIVDTRKEIKGTMQNSNAILIQVGLASDEARRAAISQRHYWDDNSRKFGQLLDRTDALIVKATEATEHIDAEAVASLKELQVSLRGVTSAMAKVEALAANPDNAETQAKMREAMVEFTASMKAAHASMDEVQAVATHYRKTLTKPAGFVKTLLGLVFGPAWKAVMAARAGR